MLLREMEDVVRGGEIRCFRGREGRCFWRRRGKMLLEEEREDVARKDVVGGAEWRCCWRSRVEMLLEEQSGDVVGGEDCSMRLRRWSR